jgi:hypothetical protein
MQQEKEYERLYELYNYITNYKNMNDLLPEDIKIIINNFKELLLKYKKNYGEREEIKKMEDSIRNGEIRTSVLKLFNEPYNFVENIKTVDKDFLENFSDITMIIKNTSTISYIFKAKFNDKPCYIKSFFGYDDNLLYEQKIYRYIKNRNECIKQYYQDYFVKIYDVCKISSTYFKDFLNEKNIKINNTENLWNTNINMVKSLNYYNFIYLIITEDIGGITYGDFFNKYYLNNSDNITKTIFDIVYIIYLMNNKMKLMHNDCHFDNILIKEDIEEYESKYEIEDIEYIKIKNYRICFYDFDLSYLSGYNNPFLYDDKWLIQNKISAKDIWTLINSILKTIYISNMDRFIKNCILNLIFGENILPNSISDGGKKFYIDTTKYLDFIIKTIIDNKTEYIDKLKDLFKKSYLQRENKVFWNTYCVDNKDKECVIPENPDLYPKEVLLRFMEEKEIMDKVNFTKIDPFYKKYLKYKTKYLKIKNKK